MIFAKRDRFKENQHVEIKNQEVKYDNFQFSHTIIDFYETNA